MSKKDVEKYYEEVANQYKDMLETLKDIEEAVQTNLLSPDRLDEIKKSIEPLKNNYMTISWIMFLLNQPTRKSKHQRYQNMQRKKIDLIDVEKLRSPTAIIDENKQVIKTLQNTKNDVERGE